MIPAELTVADLAAANAAGVVWRAEVNAAVHSEISAVPDERLAVERDLLRPLPSLRARIGKLVIRKVDRLSCVRFGSARYSVPTRHIGRQVEVRVADGQRRGRSSSAPSIADTCPLSPLVRRRSTTTTTAARGPRPRPERSAPRRPPRSRSARSGPAAVAFIKAAAAAGNSKLGRRPRRARRPRSGPRPRRPDRRPRTGRRRSVVTGRATSARSSPPAPVSPARPDPAKRSSSRCPSSPPDRCRTTRSAKRHDRPGTGARRRSRGRPPPAAARRHAPPRPRAARHRQDPTLVARRVPPHPRRSRDRVTRRVQRPRAAQGRRVPRHQDHRRVRPRRRRRSSRRPSTTSRSLEWIAATRERVPRRPRRDRQEPPARRPRPRRRRRRPPGPLLHRRRARRDPLPRSRRQQRRPRHRDTSSAPT